jgi:hypothetical protein
MAIRSLSIPREQNPKPKWITVSSLNPRPGKYGCAGSSPLSSKSSGAFTMAGASAFGFASGLFFGASVAGSTPKKCLCSSSAILRNASPSFGSAFSMITAKSKRLPLAPQPKHWKMPRSRSAENDGELRLPTCPGSGQYP